MMLHSWISLLSDDYQSALIFADTAIGAARTSIDRVNAMNARVSALVLLRQPDALPILRDFMQECEINSWRYPQCGLDGLYGIALILHGEIGSGIRWIEQAISRREKDGYRVAAD